MARRVEEIQRIRRDITPNGQNVTTNRELHQVEEPEDQYAEEYYEVGDSVPEEGLNTASGVLALALIALAIYLIWAALR